MHLCQQLDGRCPESLSARRALYRGIQDPHDGQQVWALGLSKPHTWRLSRQNAARTGDTTTPEATIRAKKTKPYIRCFRDNKERPRRTTFTTAFFSDVHLASATRPVCASLRQRRQCEASKIQTGIDRGSASGLLGPEQKPQCAFSYTLSRSQLEQRQI